MRKQPIRLCSGQAGFISIILTIIITALLVGGGTYVLVEKQVEKQITKAVQETSKNVQQQAQIRMEKLAERIEELEKEGVIEQEKSNLEESLVYKNNKYKFSLVFPDNWVGYQFEENDDGIYFGFPEQLHFWALSVMSHEDWNAIKAEEGPKPKYIAENNDYVFTYSTGHDEVPSLQGMLFEVKDIVKTFKFLDNNTTDWQTYTNEDWNISFSYPSDWEEVSGQPIGIAPNYFGYSVSVASLENNERSLPSFSVTVGGDGSGPYFPNKRLTLQKSNQGFDIIDTEDIALHDNHNESVYFVMASNNDNVNNLDYFRLSFHMPSGNNDKWDVIIKDILGSFKF